MYDIHEAQKNIYEWADRNFGPLDVREQCIGVTEELGEMAHAILKCSQGIRGYTKEKTKKEVFDAAGDIFIYLSNVCTLLGIDFEEAISDTVHKVLQRDWKENPETAGDEV